MQVGPCVRPMRYSRISKAGHLARVLAATDRVSPRDPPFLPTGADIAHDGMLYVLERDFSWLGGFSTRLRRAALSDWPTLRPETLFTQIGGLDNMEGLASWRDSDGAVRLLMIADDNFSPLQRTLLVELLVE